MYVYCATDILIPKRKHDCDTCLAEYLQQKNTGNSNPCQKVVIIHVLSLVYMFKGESTDLPTIQIETDLIMTLNVSRLLAFCIIKKTQIPIFKCCSMIKDFPYLCFNFNIWFS